MPCFPEGQASLGAGERGIDRERGLEADGFQPLRCSSGGFFCSVYFRFSNNTTWAQGAVNPDSNGERYHKLTWASQMGEPKSDADSDWRAVTGAEGTQSYMETTSYQVFPAAPNFSVEEKDAELQLKWDQCKECIKNGSWKAMYAASDAEFSALVEEMRTAADAYGYQDCISWCQEQAAIRFAAQEN